MSSQSDIFNDHTGARSFGRIASAWVLGGIGLISVFGICLIAWWVPLHRAKAVASIITNIISSGVTILGLVYASAQASKAASHIGQGMAGRANAGTAVTTTTTTSTAAAPPTSPPATAPFHSTDPGGKPATARPDTTPGATGTS